MGHSFVRILSLARLVMIDGLRRHALIGLVVFALAAEVGGLLFFDLIPRDIGRASNDFLFSITWLAGFVFLLFHCVNAVAWDDARRVIYTLLARPISRTEYVLGVFTGLSLLLLLLNISLSGIGWFVLNNIKDSVSPVYFEQLSLSVYLLTALGIYCMQLMLLAVILLFAGAVRGSFPVMLLTLSYYFICSGLPVVRGVVSSPSVEPSQGLNVLLKWMTAFFPDFSRLDFKMLVTATETLPPYNQIFPAFGLSVIYIIIVLWLSSLLYQRRDLQ